MAGVPPLHRPTGSLGGGPPAGAKCWVGALIEGKGMACGWVLSVSGLPASGVACVADAEAQTSHTERASGLLMCNPSAVTKWALTFTDHVANARESAGDLPKSSAGPPAGEVVGLDVRTSILPESAIRLLMLTASSALERLKGGT